MFPQILPTSLAVPNAFNSNAQATKKLCAMTEFLNKTVIEFPKYSTSALSTIRNVIRSELEQTGQDIEIKVKLEQDFLAIKQTFLHGRPQVSFQYDGCMPSVRDNFSLRDLMAELHRVLAGRIEKKFASSPPIRKLRYDNVIQTVQIIESNMKDWNAVVEPKETDQQRDIDPNDWETPKRTMQKRWNMKIKSTSSILRCIRNRELNTDSEFYAYEVSGVPVGIMVLTVEDKKPYVEISLLVAHPGSQCVGGSLVELAVKRSIEVGRNGILRLDAIDDDAVQAYLAMGFTRTPDCDMALDPASGTDKWCQTELGEWKLESYVDKRYMWAAFDSDGAYENQEDPVSFV